MTPKPKRIKSKDAPKGNEGNHEHWGSLRFQDTSERTFKIDSVDGILSLERYHNEALPELIPLRLDYPNQSVVEINYEALHAGFDLWAFRLETSIPLLGQAVDSSIRSISEGIKESEAFDDLVEILVRLRRAFPKKKYKVEERNYQLYGGFVTCSEALGVSVPMLTYIIDGIIEQRNREMTERLLSLQKKK